MTALNADMVRFAQLMARDHGHTWGRLDLTGVEFTTEAISQACRDQGLITLLGREEFMPGITSPKLNESGSIVHTTGSGGFSWEVSSTWAVLEWSRPTGVFCRITIGWGDLIPSVGVEAFAPRHKYSTVARIYERHIFRVLHDFGVAYAAAMEVCEVVPPDFSPAYWKHHHDTIVAALDPMRVDEFHDLQQIASRLDDQARRMRETAEDCLVSAAYHLTGY